MILTRKWFGMFGLPVASLVNAHGIHGFKVENTIHVRYLTL